MGGQNTPFYLLILVHSADAQELVSGLVSELRRGTLILLVLSRLRQERYGYELVKELSDRGIPMDANTLYPLLRRLEGQGLLESTWRTDEPKPRKYYRLTALGGEVFSRATEYWRRFSRQVDQCLEG